MPESRNPRLLFILLSIALITVISCSRTDDPQEPAASVVKEIIEPAATPPPPTAQTVVVPTLTTRDKTVQDGWVQDTLAGMSDEEKIGQVILSGIGGTEGTDETCGVITELKPAGIFYMPGNIVNPQQLQQFSSTLQECAQSSGIQPLLISVDHEGENRYAFTSGITNFPSQMAIGATGEPETAFHIAEAAGSELLYSGVNHILGPVADVYSSLDNRLFADRTYGGDSENVSEFVASAVEGYEQAGLIPTLKHYPGHGGSETFYATKVLPVDMVEADTLASIYLSPFWSGIEAGYPVVLVSHVIYPNISGSYDPASLSPEILTILREQARFDGVIMSDAILSAEGITDDEGNVPEAALDVLNAGVDLLFIPEAGQALATQKFLLDALETSELPQSRLDEAVSHILDLKAGHNLKEFPIQHATEPDWEKNSDLAYETGQNSLALFRDNQSLLPVSDDIQSVLIIGPDENWEFYSELVQRLEDQGKEVEVVNYSPPWDGTIKERELVQTLPRDAERYDITIFFTWRAHLDAVAQDAWQSNLGKKLSKLEQPVLIVALNNPSDIFEFPKIGTYLAAHGTTEGQLDAIIDTIIGEWTPTGIIPFPEFYE